ncbi:hypothetical protein MIZ01_0959 [Sideroxyarcus emersonii]|uniref:DUF3579 domain-containing protein n=1 Tax=Sideroxyarcus emersonii TaxID=2764705 RepID=A0AAN2BYL6_9PROT|nr:DUF3579 domain-containing protein [Sideroxyarcus emersonii]BCK87188.1 hypothetical protein MIZ01_0959 [Sideroxyarcus emersonii]
MLPGAAEFVVYGKTVDGQVFQQPQWAEQLCGKLGAADANGQSRYSSHLRPVQIDGVPALVVRLSLQLVDEPAFEMIKRFVAEHRLQVRAGRGSRDAEAMEAYLAAGQERRSPDNGW